MDDFESQYLRLVEAVRKPTKDNWTFRYDQGLRLQRVEQGRRLVAQTPVLRELKFMIDLENPLAKEAYTAFVSGKPTTLRFAAAWSNPNWKVSAGRMPNASPGDSTRSDFSSNGVSSS